MNQLREILNRDGTIDPSGWLHLIAKGDVPIEIEQGDKVINLIQRYDDTGLQQIVNRFSADAATAGDRWAGLLLDWDHFSSDSDKSSEAAGWIMELKLRDDGVWGRVDWSNSGRDAVIGKRFKFASSTHALTDCQFLGDSIVRPVAIKKAALTNVPRNRLLKPYASDAELLNKAIEKNNEKKIDTVPANDTNASEAENQEGNVMDYKAKLIAMLKLAPDASDADIETAIAAMESNMTEQANAAAANTEAMNTLRTTHTAELASRDSRITVLETELVEHDLATYAPVITDPTAIKTQLLQNRSGTLAILKSIKPAARILHNRGGDPSAPLLDGVSAKQIELVNSLRTNDKTLTFEQAWERAKQQKPELFNQPKE